MQNFKKVNKEKSKTEENEIRVTSKGLIKSYLGYAFRVLEADKLNKNELVIKATGNAIVKALILIELVKRRIGNLHQINEITSMEIVDTFEPMVEGLEQIEQKRRVTAMETRLLKTLDNESQKQHLGYQEPTPPEERVFREPREPREPREYNRDDRPSGGRPAKRYNDSGPEKREPREGDDRPTRGGPSRGGPRGGFRGFRGGRGT